MAGQPGQSLEPEIAEGSRRPVQPEIAACLTRYDTSVLHARPAQSAETTACDGSFLTPSGRLVCLPASSSAGFCGPAALTGHVAA